MVVVRSRSRRGEVTYAFPTCECPTTADPCHKNSSREAVRCKQRNMCLDMQKWPQCKVEQNHNSEHPIWTLLRFVAMKVCTQRKNHTERPPTF